MGATVSSPGEASCSSQTAKSDRSPRHVHLICRVSRANLDQPPGLSAAHSISRSRPRHAAGSPATPGPLQTAAARADRRSNHANAGRACRTVRRSRRRLPRCMGDGSPLASCRRARLSSRAATRFLGTCVVALLQRQKSQVKSTTPSRDRMPVTIAATPTSRPSSTLAFGRPARSDVNLSKSGWPSAAIASCAVVAARGKARPLKDRPIPAAIKSSRSAWRGRLTRQVDSQVPHRGRGGRPRFPRAGHAQGAGRTGARAHVALASRSR